MRDEGCFAEKSSIFKPRFWCIPAVLPLDLEDVSASAAERSGASGRALASPRHAGARAHTRLPHLAEYGRGRPAEGLCCCPSSGLAEYGVVPQDVANRLITSLPRPSGRTGASCPWPGVSVRARYGAPSDWPAIRTRARACSRAATARKRSAFRAGCFSWGR